VKKLISTVVNGDPYELLVAPQVTLADFLRDELGLTGTKKSCELGECGACTVIMDGRAVNSCLVLAIEAHGKEIMTIEGLSQNGALAPLQRAFVDQGAVQCGFCTPGMLLSAKALLEAKPTPSQAEIRRALAGNLCRCTGYVRIVRAIASVAEASQV
jgi:aerobic carbon-monoxide dehydrogenase small subunit